jgi:SNF2 family DNA or RNA helicase
LIICPYVLRYAWQEEFVKWIPNIKLEYIQVFGTSTAETFNPQAKIYIISYQLITHMIQQFSDKGFKLAIVD